MKRSGTLLWIALIAAVAVGAAIDRWPLSDASARLERLPAFGLGFTTKVEPVDDSERAVFGAATVYRRLVAARGERWLLTVVDGTRNRHAIHDPHYCFRGAGYQVVRETPVALPGGSGCRTELERRGRRRTLLWYFSDGDRRHTSPVQVWAMSALRRISLGSSGPAPVLVLIESLDPNGNPERLGKVLPDICVL